MVAALIGIDDRHAFTRKVDLMILLDACPDLDIHVFAVDGRDSDNPTQDGIEDTHLDIREQMLAISRETLIGLDEDRHIEIAGRQIGVNILSGARDTDARSVINARRNLDANFATVEF